VVITAVMKVEGLDLEVLRVTARLGSRCSYAERIIRLPCSPETLTETSSSGETLIVN
jgi:hypothetical protein